MVSAQPKIRPESINVHATGNMQETNGKLRHYRHLTLKCYMTPDQKLLGWHANCYRVKPLTHCRLLRTPAQTTSLRRLHPPIPSRRSPAAHVAKAALFVPSTLP
ncbi:protein of unknown function [Paraburkholderia kururiensis]